MNWQGEDGESGFPGLQGPPGAKVQISVPLWRRLMWMSFHATCWRCTVCENRASPARGRKEREAWMDSRDWRWKTNRKLHLTNTYINTFLRYIIISTLFKTDWLICAIKQGDKGGQGEQGPQGPLVCAQKHLITCVFLQLFAHLSLVVARLCLRVILVKKAQQAPRTSSTSMGSFLMLSRWVILKRQWDHINGCIVCSTRHL